MAFFYWVLLDNFVLASLLDCKCLSRSFFYSFTARWVAPPSAIKSQNDVPDKGRYTYVVASIWIWGQIKLHACFTCKSGKYYSWIGGSSNSWPTFFSRTRPYFTDFGSKNFQEGSWDFIFRIIFWNFFLRLGTDTLGGKGGLKGEGNCPPSNRPKLRPCLICCGCSWVKVYMTQL